MSSQSQKTEALAREDQPSPQASGLPGGSPAGSPGDGADPQLDELVELAAALFGTASALIGVPEAGRLVCRAACGPVGDAPQLLGPLVERVMAGRESLVVPDADVADPAADRPTLPPGCGIRFFAAAPIMPDSGPCLGALCVFAASPRESGAPVRTDALATLAGLAAERIASRQGGRMDQIAAKVVATSSDAILAADPDGRIVFWNPAAEAMFGYAEKQALGQQVTLIIPEKSARGHDRVYSSAAAGGPTRLVGAPVELVAKRSDGSEFPVELSLTPWGHPSPQTGFAAIVRDISDRKQLEREREEARAFLSTVVAHMPAMFFVKDVDTRKYLLINQFAERVIGRPANEVIGRTDEELFPGIGRDFMARDTLALNADTPQTFESQFVGKDGETAILRTTRSVITGSEPSKRYLLGVSEDVTRMRRAEAEVIRLARHDSLTGLGNRASLTTRINDLVCAKTPFAMLSIDLDRFKAINDQFGHPTGDEVLVQVGERVRSMVDRDDFVARVGADEFVVILTGERLYERSLDVSANLVERLREPFATERATAFCGASIGMVLHPQHGDSPGQLREHADLALYRAKQSKCGIACFFSPEMDVAEHDRRKLEADLRLAVTRQAIDLAYQPVVSARSGQITSCEALARWTHPTRGPVSPACFVPLVEECGLIEVFGANLLHKACSSALAWPQDVRVAVNLSALQFKSGNLPDTVSKILAETGFEAQRLQLEVTESLLITDVEGTFRQLRELRDLGIQILMDDFGVGYCSLSYFQRGCFDKVKLDRSIVQHVAIKESRAIIEAVVGIGQKLGMGIVAEGVETEEQMQLIAASGCTHVQGYLFGRAMAPDHIVDVLRRPRPDHGMIRAGAGPPGTWAAAL